jgi:Flp pilus assembly pilin Flp
MIRFGLKFLRDERGFAATEFAMWLPVILLILLGCFEATRYIMIHQKLDRAATQVADLVGQAEALTTGQLDEIYKAAAAQMEPYDMEGQGEIIISSVVNSAGTVTVSWQRNHGSAGGSSSIGVEGGVANLPDNFYLVDSESSIVAEVLYDYEPVFFGTLAGLKNFGGDSLFGDMFQATTFKHEAWARPRGASLVSPPA